MDPTEALRNNPVFKSANSSALSILLAGTSVQEHAQDERLFSAGDTADAVAVLIEGTVRVFLDEDGSQVTLRHLVAPDILGDVELLSDAPFVANIDALTSATTLRLQRTAFLDFLTADPGTQLQLLSNVSRRFCVAARNQSAVLFDVPARLASLLLAYASTFSRETSHGLQVRYPLTQASMAAELGVNQRSVRRTLADWKARDVIKVHKGWLLLLNRKALEEASGGLRCNIAYSADQDLSAELGPLSE